MRDLRMRVFHLSAYAKAQAKNFEHDVDTMLAMRPHYATMTEVGARRDDLADILRDSGYRPAYGQHRECAYLYDYEGGVRLCGDVDSIKAHDKGPGYPSRSLLRARFDVEGEDVVAFAGHWLAHLADSPARVRDHNRMTTIAVREMKRAARGKTIVTLGCDANEADKPGSREDSPLGNMATQFRKGGITTCWDEVGKHPTTFGNRPPIDLIATVDADTRVSIQSVVAVNVRGDHDLIGAIARVKRGR